MQNDSKESILLQLFRALDVKILAHWGPQWKNAQLREVPPALLAWVNSTGTVGRCDACRLIFVAHVLYDIDVVEFLKHHNVMISLEQRSKTKDTWRKVLSALTFNLWLTQSVLSSQVQSLTHPTRDCAP